MAGRRGCPGRGHLGLDAVRFRDPWSLVAAVLGISAANALVEPIVGAPAVHRVLVGWLASLGPRAAPRAGEGDVPAG